MRRPREPVVSDGSAPLVTVVVPLYKSAGSADALVDRLDALQRSLAPSLLEVVFVDDASPDDVVQRLERHFPCTFAVRVVRHSRNFGSFAAIRTGIASADGQFVGVMAADLQEPPALIADMVGELRRTTADIAYGVRAGRDGDTMGARVASSLFWRGYRRLVQPEMPIGGVDVFVCRRHVADQLLGMTEANSSLVGSLVWLGFPSIAVPYTRQPRADGGTSAWSLSRRVRYMSDSAFSFSRLPLTLLGWTGLMGLLACTVTGATVLTGRLLGRVDVPGYTALMLTLLFCTSLVLVALWIVGEMAWRAYENTKSRPLAVVSRRAEYPSKPRQEQP